jgi:transcriptional regulator with XRE-family HTH domain
MKFYTETKNLARFGENLKFARLRRDISAQMMAERAGISRTTLSKLEAGGSGVSLGTLAAVLFVLGLEKDLEKIAEDDVLGRKLHDAKIMPKKRASKAASR